MIIQDNKQKISFSLHKLNIEVFLPSFRLYSKISEKVVVRICLSNYERYWF